MKDEANEKTGHRGKQLPPLMDAANLKSHKFTRYSYS